VIWLLLLQAAAATPAATPAPPAAPVTRASSAPSGNSFSILADPCARSGTTPVGNDVVVCGKGADTRRLPLPDEREPTGPTASNPNRTGTGALIASSTPCAASIGGCQVGFGQPLVAAAVKGLVTAVSDGIADRKVRRARRETAGQRVAIPLDDPAVPANTQGRVLP
jgi:hypothetical protein